MRVQIFKFGVLWLNYNVKFFGFIFGCCSNRVASAIKPKVAVGLAGDFGALQGPHRITGSMFAIWSRWILHPYHPINRNSSP